MSHCAALANMRSLNVWRYLAATAPAAALLSQPPDVDLDYAILKGRTNAVDHSWEYLGKL